MPDFICQFRSMPWKKMFLGFLESTSLSIHGLSSSLLSSRQKPIGLVSIETVLFNDKQDNFSVCVEHDINQAQAYD